MAAHDKTAARKQARIRRAAIPQSIRNDAGDQGATHFLDAINLSPKSTLSAYWPLGDEFDSLPLLQALLQAGHRIALPVVQGASQPLCFRVWQPGDAMAVSSFGVSEPLAAAAEVQPDVVVTPFLAYNDAGYRLGYGGGYYDRTLRVLRLARPDVLALGLGFAVQQMSVLPHDAHDEPLDWLVNEQGAQRFAR